MIGYKGSPEDRQARWRSMIDFKNHRVVFGGSTDEWEIRQLERANDNYQKFLERYVDDAA